MNERVARFKKSVEIVEEILPLYKESGRSVSELEANLRTARDGGGRGQIDRSLDIELSNMVGDRQLRCRGKGTG